MDPVITKILDRLSIIEKYLDQLKRRQIRPATQRYYEYRIEAPRTALGASAPTVTTRAAGASGGVKIPVLSFSKTVSQECFFIFHYQNDQDFAQPVEFHMMWIPATGYSTGNFMWKLEYLIYDEYTGDISSGIPTTIEESVTPADAITLIETEYSDTITLEEDQILIGRFYRDTANDNGDVAGEVLFFEINYPVAYNW